ncbi:hypothetical protein D3C81_2306300 [compost metagenome]
MNADAGADIAGAWDLDHLHMAARGQHGRQVVATQIALVVEADDQVRRFHPFDHGL